MKECTYEVSSNMDEYHLMRPYLILIHMPCPYSPSVLHRFRVVVARYRTTSVSMPRSAVQVRSFLSGIEARFSAGFRVHFADLQHIDAT